MQKPLSGYCTFQESDLKINPIKYSIFLLHMKIPISIWLILKQGIPNILTEQCKKLLHEKLQLLKNSIAEACDKLLQLGLSHLLLLKTLHTLQVIIILHSNPLDGIVHVVKRTTDEFDCVQRTFCKISLTYRYCGFRAHTPVPTEAPTITINFHSHIGANTAQ